jgi:hypothetical protein
MRRTLVALVLVALVSVVGAGPVSAETATVTDPKGDGGDYDIRSLFVNNGKRTIAFRLKFVELHPQPFGGDEVHFIHPKTKSEWVLRAYRNYMTGKWQYSLHRLGSDGSFGENIPCKISRKRDYDREIARYSFARSCISNLPNRLRFWAVVANAMVDETAKTPALARG